MATALWIIVGGLAGAVVAVAAGAALLQIIFYVAGGAIWALFAAGLWQERQAKLTIPSSVSSPSSSVSAQEARQWLNDLLRRQQE